MTKLAQSKKSKQDSSEELKKIVLERLKVMPENLSVSIGNSEYSQDELLKHVEAGDDVGKEIMSVQLKYLRDLASGKIFESE